ncbi:hypothetical protein GGU11DRAFT_756573 [Lentinula aff. detonsa]|uniref:Uncharacterized protein n=1 Tax=Lentinula aff. detonsa TaxID=2804958 RepID=A0AA38KPP7_9AGAR|nr:hypothetical protein GGU10DRAFT_378907 [Lentinula aff. detonsa]KAJ3797659.1 hypothetical protein GGU11DRAFT_756573 [Lentinula aff. detonsa]
MSLGVMSYPMALSTRYEDPSFRQLGPRMPAPLRGETRLVLMRWLWKDPAHEDGEVPNFEGFRGEYIVVGPNPNGSIQVDANECWAICVGLQCLSVGMNMDFSKVANFHLFTLPMRFRQSVTDLGAEVDWSTPEKKKEDTDRFKKSALSSPHVLEFFNTAVVDDLLKRGRLHEGSGGQVLTQLPVWNAHYNAMKKAITGM